LRLLDPSLHQHVAVAKVHGRLIDYGCCNGCRAARCRCAQRKFDFFCRSSAVVLGLKWRKYKDRARRCERLEGPAVGAMGQEHQWPRSTGCSRRPLAHNGTCSLMAHRSGRAKSCFNAGSSRNGEDTKTGHDAASDGRALRWDAMRQNILQGENNICILQRENNIYM